MNPILLLSIIGSIASLTSLLISGPQLKSRIIHLIYSLVLTALAGGSVILFQQQDSRMKVLESKISDYENISKNASRILKSYEYSSDVGKNRGFILTSFAFLEKNKGEFPEMYNMAKELVTKGILVTQSAPDGDLNQKWNEEKRMKDGAQTMEAILEGIKH